MEQFSLANRSTGSPQELLEERFHYEMLWLRTVGDFNMDYTVHCLQHYDAEGFLDYRHNEILNASILYQWPNIMPQEFINGKWPLFVAVLYVYRARADLAYYSTQVQLLHRAGCLRYVPSRSNFMHCNNRIYFVGWSHVYCFSMVSFKIFSH